MYRKETYAQTPHTQAGSSPDRVFTRLGGAVFIRRKTYAGIEGNPAPYSYQAEKELQLIDLKELIPLPGPPLSSWWPGTSRSSTNRRFWGGYGPIIQPFFMMVVFTLFFGKLARIPSDGIPYPIFNLQRHGGLDIFCAGQSDSRATASSASSNLISKVYFPRLIIPLTPVISGLLDFSIAFIGAPGHDGFTFEYYPPMTVFILPFLVLIMMLTASGVGMILAALNAKYRDIRYTIPFLMQFWMFASPIVYPASLVPGRYRMLYALNPMAGVIEGFRSALLGRTVSRGHGAHFVPRELPALLVGIIYFKQVERYFADVI